MRDASGLYITNMTKILWYSGGKETNHFVRENNFDNVLRNLQNKNGLNAAYLKDIFENRPSKYPSKNENNMYIPKYNQLTYGYNSCRVQGAKFFNYLPNEVKDVTSTFQKYIK